MPKRLTPVQQDYFRKQGYLLFHEPVLPVAEFQALQAHFERLLAEWTLAGSGKSPEHMDVPHFTDPGLFRWIFNPRVLDLVEDLIGPDIALWSTHFICKPPGVGKRVPWHEDSAYWGTVLDPMEVVTIWLALDPSTPQNGCMRVIPGTHHNGYSQYEPVSDPAKQVFSTELKEGQFDPATAVDCTLAPNECSIHHAKLIHGSEPNTSAIRRCGYTMRFVPMTSRFRVGDDSWRKTFQIYKARGQDRAGNPYGDPTRINERWVNANPAERLRVKQLIG